MVSIGVFYDHWRIFWTFSIRFLGRYFFLNVSNGAWCSAFDCAPLVIIIVNQTLTSHHGLNSESHSNTWCFDITCVLSWNVVQILQHAGQPIKLQWASKSYLDPSETTKLGNVLSLTVISENKTDGRVDQHYGHLAVKYRKYRSNGSQAVGWVFFCTPHSNVPHSSLHITIPEDVTSSPIDQTLKVHPVDRLPHIM